MKIILFLRFCVKGMWLFIMRGRLFFINFDFLIVVGFILGGGVVESSEYFLVRIEVGKK